MFAFVCPIRHPDTSNNYNEVIKLLELTISSICSQTTTEDFVFIVVCNKAPQLNISPQNASKVIFVAVDFPPPDNNKGTSVSLEAVKFDKGTKIARGLLYLKSYMPDYVYIIDGDDWININVLSSISDYTKNKNEKNNIDLWYANAGYIVNLKDQIYIKSYGMCRYCGSTYIYKYETLMDLTCLSNLHNSEASQAEISKAVEDHTLKNILGNHRQQLPFYKAHDRKMKEIPIPSVCWILNNGENHTGEDGGHFGLPLTPSFIKDFGISSLTIKPQKIKIKFILLTIFSTFKSWAGWLLTNKNSDKI